MAGVRVGVEVGWLLGTAPRVEEVWEPEGRDGRPAGVRLGTSRRSG